MPYDINLFGQTYNGVQSVVYNGNVVNKLILNGTEYVFATVPDYTTGITYTVVSSTYVTVAYGTATATNIILRDTYNGYPVTHISANGFNGKSNITGIIFPSGLTTIGSSAFQECTKLVFNELPIGVSDIPTSCFRDCTSLVSLNLKSVKTIQGSLTGGGFNGCTNLVSVTIGSVGKAVTSINKYAFRNCDNISEFVIYTTNGASLPDSPWGGGTSNVSITYLRA